MSDLEERVKKAKAAYIRLMSESTERKDRALQAMANALDVDRERIKAANLKDIEAAEEMLAEGKLTKSMLKRLKVDDTKIDDMIAGIMDVMKLPDPVGKTLEALELDNGLELYKVSTPIGLIGVIFESRPDVVPQIMALCLKSGNATVFKGGSEAKESNRALFNVLVGAIASVDGMPAEAFQLMETRDEVKEMLKL
nr:gamma-glutamyl-phosphate reductase [Candidatus Methanomethylophilaceae archaeon]